MSQTIIVPLLNIYRTLILLIFLVYRLLGRVDIFSKQIYVEFLRMQITLYYIATRVTAIWLRNVFPFGYIISVGLMTRSS